MGDVADMINDDSPPDDGARTKEHDRRAKEITDAIPWIADTTNPKDLMGRSKVMTLSVIPSTALIHMGEAMRYGALEAPLKDGGKGYGRFNWRDTKIAAMLYIDAAFRHILDWVDGEECAGDSGAKHLGHAMACLGILIDAQACQTLVDDRPTKGPASKLFASLVRGI